MLLCCRLLFNSRPANGWTERKLSSADGAGTASFCLLVPAPSASMNLGAECDVAFHALVLPVYRLCFQ
jgi:hypothetical protein